MISRSFLEQLITSSKRELPENLERIVSEQEDASLRSPGVEAHYYRYLYFLCQNLKPALMLELGTHTGISAMCMAMGNPDGILVTVNDKHELRDDCRRDNIRYVYHDSLISVRPTKKIDLLFIDTWHDGVRCEKEFELYKDCMKKDGIIFFDDIFLFDCMKDFWNKFNPVGYTKIELPIHSTAGFGCLVKTEALEA